jgi:hypothetical protein
MSLSLTITEIRTSTSVPFYEMSQQYLDHIQKYNNSGQRTGTKGIYDFSVDELTRTGVIQFATQEDYDLIQADPVVVIEFARWDDHNKTANISVNRTLA